MERSVGIVDDASVTDKEGLVEDAPVAPPKLEPYTLTLQEMLLEQATTTRTLETGDTADGEKEDTKLVDEPTRSAGEVAAHVAPALQRRI